MRLFGCPVTILNTIDHLGKYDGKADEGFFVGYSLNSKAFRVFNSRTRIVEENLHYRFSKNTPNVVGSGPDWLFDIDALTRTMNYKIVACTLEWFLQVRKQVIMQVKLERRQNLSKITFYYHCGLLIHHFPKIQRVLKMMDPNLHVMMRRRMMKIQEKIVKIIDQKKEDNVNSTNNVNVASINEVNAVGGKTSIELPDDPNMPALEDISIFDLSRDNEDGGAEADMNNFDKTIQVSPIPSIRIHKDHPFNQVIRDFQSAAQTRNMSKNLEEHGKNAKRNKKDERGIVIRNKERLVAQGYTQEEWIEYDEVFPHVARIKAIRLILAYASFKDFVVYQMDVKSAFLYGKIEEEVYKGDILLVQVYVDDIIFSSTKKELCNAFEKKKDGIFISQDKYVGDISKKFGFTEVKTASTLIETQKPFLKDEDGEEVDVHMYRSMIGSFMYLTSSRPDIMFAVCACARYQVNPKVSHLYAVKRILRYLKSQPKLGLWSPKDSPFDLVAYTDSDYDGASLDRKSTTREAEYVVLQVAVDKCFGFRINYLIMALVDGKKIIIIELIVRRDLQLKDAEGVDCLPNATIFEKHTLMGYENISQKLTFYKAFFSPQWKFLIHTILQCLSYKTTAWNKFSNTMASAIICLATNQKFNFSKYIFESMVKNLDNVGNFLMYLRFVQVFVNQQLDGLPSHKRIYVSPSHTKKIFRNMKRVGKGFSGRVTPLFPIMVVHNQEEMGEGSAMLIDPYHTPTIIQPSTSQPQKTQKPRRSKRKDTEVPQPSGPTTNVADKAVNKEMDDSLVTAATTASSLEAEQDNGNINKTQSKATPNELSFPGTSLGGGPRRQETMGDTIAQTRSENVSKLSNDPLLARGNTLRCGDDSLKLQELMALCTTLQSRVLNLETTKTTQANEIASLKRRVKKLEKKNKSRTHKLKRLYKVGLSVRVESSRNEESLGEDASKQGRRIIDIDDDEDITLVNDQIDADAKMFDVDTLTGDEVLAEQVVAAKDVNLSVDEVTLAQALAALKSAKVQEKGDVIKEPSVPVSTVTASTKDSAATTTTATIPTPRKGIDKGKGKMVEPEKPMKKKELIRLDEEIASKLQAEFDEEVRLAREKAEKEQEANVALTEEWDDIQAKIEADHELAQRLQAQEQEELSDAEKATLFVQLLEKRRKHFAAKRAEEKRNKPPTQAQQRKIMCTYLKNMEGKKPKDLKNKSFDSIQKMFDRAFKRVNTFVDFRTDLVEGSSKRAGEELEQESSKKQKVDDDKETTELKSLMEVIPDEEEVALDAIPLAVKSPSIVDWKIHKEGKKSYYQIIRADGSSKMYLVFSHMLKSFDREDLETLYKLVKAKYGSTRPVEDLDLVLYGDLKTMFEPHVEDNVWKNQSDYRVLDWKLYDSCGVHSLRKQNVHIHMLVEKRYPFTAPTITDMLNKKLQSNQASKSVLRLGIVPIGLAASGNLFSCPKSKKQVTPNPPEGGSKATSKGDWIKVQKKGKGKDPERIYGHLEDPVSHAPLAFNSQGEHSEGKPALAFSTPTRILLGGSSEPLNLSTDHKPLGGCKPKERLDGMKLDQWERKHDQSNLVSEAGREGIEAHEAVSSLAPCYKEWSDLQARRKSVRIGSETVRLSIASTWDNLSLGYDLNSTFKKEPNQANQEIGSDRGERELLLKEGESLLLRRRAIYLVATGSATLGSPYGATHRSFRSSESHCSGLIIPMSEVEQLRCCRSRLDPRMSPRSSLGVVTEALLSQDTLPGSSLLTGLMILSSLRINPLAKVFLVFLSVHAGVLLASGDIDLKLEYVVTPDPKHPFSIHRDIQSSKSIKRPSWTKIQRDQSCWEERARNDLLKDYKVLKWQDRGKANCLLAGSYMSDNVHVQLREKGGGQKWPCCISLSSSMGFALSFLGEYANGGVDTLVRITGDSYKNGGEVNSTRRNSGMDVDPSGRDNHSGPERGGNHSQEPKRLI
ncbi:putative ribonuclease H-like domain-containing protein [Tanacetum coccineum]